MKEAIVKLSAAIILLFLTLIVFHLFQNPFVYNHSLGTISKNYVNHGNWNIEKAKVPFVTISEENLNHWDVVHYQSIRDHGYDLREGSGKWAYAFFPLFPYLWKYSGLDAVGICILNYLLFAISIVLLSVVFLPEYLSKRTRWALFLLALLLPGTVVFSIPYTESFFLFSFSLACLGSRLSYRWLTFLGFGLVGMSRPAVTILLGSMIATDVYLTILGKNDRVKLREIFSRILPVVIGTGIALLIQHHYSGEWFKFIGVEKEWGNQHFQIPKKISDWSEEGFGMSVFITLAVTLPAIIYLIINVYHKLKKDLGYKPKFDYYVILSMMYGILTSMYIIFFRGGSMNGMQRYVGATPMFYILFFSVLPLLGQIKLRNKVWLFFGLIFTGTVILAISGYATQFSFSDAGFYLFVFVLGYILFSEHWSSLSRRLTFGLLVFFLIIWKTYLFNMLLSDSWIFT